MMRLPPFRYSAPGTAREAARILAGEGPDAMPVAGGTDLYPNMKRRHQTPRTVVSLHRVAGLRGIDGAPETGIRIGAATSLAEIVRDETIRAAHPAVWKAVRSISTPALRNMGTIGGNLCLDTRCNYYDQSEEWRRSIHYCLKCNGDTCWVAPSSARCLAVQSSDSAPVMVALGAKIRLLGPDGERTIDAAELYGEDGIAYLAKRRDELLLDVTLPATNGWSATYWKLRRRGAFDFPVLGVAAWVARDGAGVVTDARLVLGAVESFPIRVTAAEAKLVGTKLDDTAITAAAKLASKVARPFDNTDYEVRWRKAMAEKYVRGALTELRAG